MNPSTRSATTIVAALVAAGVREIVLCPGSRSSPLAYAARAAEQAGHLRLHVRVDERSAAFLALGLAKVSRRPAVVITTSGTAVANLHPAVLEAHHAHVPLVVLSADRPAALRRTGANQTTIQPGIFGPAVRFEADIAPDLPAEEAAALARTAATIPARGAHCGPVHLNVQFAEPLVPDDPLVPEPGTPPPPPEASAGVVAPATTPALHSVVGEAVALPERTLVVLGDLPTLDESAEVLAWAGRRSLPVIAEPFGPHPRPAVVPHGVLVLGVEAFTATHRPQTIVLAGRPTLSRPVTRLLLDPAPDLVVLDAGLELEIPGRTARRVPWADLDALHVTGDPTPFRDAWLAAGARVATAIAAAPAPEGTGPALARALVEALPDGALLFLGSSNAPRDLDLAVTARRRLDVVASRGLAGIDGCVSTAIGLALASPGRTVVALLGDLTFLHDSGGLLIGPQEPRPNLTIVVANDDGGGIFTTLEPGDPGRAEGFERLFRTPTGTDLGALCRAHGIRHRQVRAATDVTAALAEPASGIEVLEVAVDGTTHRAERARLEDLAHTALA